MTSLLSKLKLELNSKASVLVLALGLMAIPSAEASLDEYVFIAEWGVAGAGNGQFNEPSGIAVDRDGNVYVADRGNHRIQKFTNNGQFITKWEQKETNKDNSTNLLG